MPDFNKRNNQPELLDQPGIPFADIEQNMRELDFINRWLGGHGISCSGLKQLLQEKRTGELLHIAEIGCGNGNNLVAIDRWCRTQGINARYTGVDLNPECIRSAVELDALPQSEWICSDYREVFFETKPDIIFTSLFCHHFTDPELVVQLQWLQQQAGIGFFINDLHRHPLAYWSIKILTRLFSRSYLVKNDAPLSVSRGFTRKDWEDLFKQAGIGTFTIRWKWAFRWLICYRQNAIPVS